MKSWEIAIFFFGFALVGIGIRFIGFFSFLNQPFASSSINLGIISLPLFFLLFIFGIVGILAIILGITLMILAVKNKKEEDK